MADADAVRAIAGAMPAQQFTLADTWPARLARQLVNAARLPGDVYQGRTSMWGEDGRTNPEVIHRAADLAGLEMMGSLAGIPDDALASGFARMRVNPLEQADLGRELAVLRRNKGWHTGKSAEGWEFKRPDAEKGSFARAVAEARAGFRGDADRAILDYGRAAPGNPYMTPEDWAFIESGGFK